MSKTLTFESELAASPEAVWAWIIFFEGISKEMAPVLHMSARKGITDLSSVNFTPGVPMFRSWIILGESCRSTTAI